MGIYFIARIIHVSIMYKENNLKKSYFYPDKMYFIISIFGYNHSFHYLSISR